MHSAGHHSLTASRLSIPDGHIFWPQECHWLQRRSHWPLEVTYLPGRAARSRCVAGDPWSPHRPAERCQQSIYQCIVNISWSGLDITIRGSLSVMLFRVQSNLRYQVVCLWVRVSYLNTIILESIYWCNIQLYLSDSQLFWRSPKSCGQKY